MNRIQFFVLIGLSSLVVVLLIGHIFLVRQTNFEQNRLAAAQQVISQGQAFGGNFKQLALQIGQDSQSKSDQALKDLLTRQNITYNPNPAPGPENTNATSPAPSAFPLTH